MLSENDIVSDFLVESSENLDRLDRDLVGLEKNPHDKNALAGVFRTIHTIKGTCGFLGFNKLERVAHVGENLLTRLRDGQLTLTPQITTVLLSMVDAVRQMLKEIQATGHDGEEEYPDLCETLTQLQSADSTGGTDTPATQSSVETAPTATLEMPDPEKLPIPSEQTTHTAVLPTAPQKKLNKGGARKPAHGKIGGVLVDKGHVQPEDIVRALEAQERGDRRRLGEILVAMGLAKPEDVLAAQELMDLKSRDIAPETIRVGVNLLDRLMTLVGELVLARNQLLQFSNTMENPALHAITQRMNLIAMELQEDIMRTRMQPIGNIWAQFPRTVRDVALGCGKQVHIEMEGKETELDKTIIEAIKDPLTHLVRNSVDHGIELPDARAKAGKNPSGLLSLRAFHEGGQVNIEISDDGGGLNRERIRQKAIERGIIRAEQAVRLSEREIFNLIFLPGFSTAEKVTNVSGRGVGMDVVKTNVEKIGGTVDIESVPGQSTSVRVKIPLTLAIIPALVVGCAGERYAIPQVNLLELVRLEGSEVKSNIETLQGAQVYRLRGRLLPLVYLARELQLAQDVPRSNADDALNIVVLQADDRNFGLVVDAIHDTEEIVVKPLRKQLKSVKIFAGSSIMGDGRVALIIDVIGLAHRANVLTELKDRAVIEKSAESAEASAKQTFLLFAGLGDSRMAIPLSCLARLEELPVSQVEMSGRQWVTQYRGQILPLLRLNVLMEERRKKLQGLLKPPRPDSAPLQILVLNHDGRSFGLVVDRILDIVEDKGEVKSAATRPAVLYSIVIADRITELLDIPAILRISGIMPEANVYAGALGASK